MQLLFSKSALLIAGITYLIVIIVFAIGWFIPAGGGFLSFPRKSVATALAVLALIPVIIVSVLYIILYIKSSHVLIGYLVLTVGIIGVVGGTVFAIERITTAIQDRRMAEITKQQNVYINSTIAPVIKKAYPNAQFFVDRFGVVVRLGGYDYENQPIFDDEIMKWKAIKQDQVFDNYPYSIRVAYHFENTEDNFAGIHLSDFTLFYNKLGMSKAGIIYLTPIFQGHLNNYYSGFTIESTYYFSISIDKTLHSDEEPIEARLWQEFASINNINTELVGITVAYRHPDNPSNVRYYEVCQDRWFGGNNK